MRIFSIALIFAFLTSIAPAAAGDRYISDLHDGALLGQIESTSQLQLAFQRQTSQLAQAGAEIGLTPQQFAEVHRKIATGQARYVELPQHIDAMSGKHDGHVFFVRNIRIPKGVYGWEVDLTEPNYLVKVYVPNRCGNLSLVRVRRPQVLAAAPVYHDVYNVPAPAAAPMNLPAAAPAIYAPVTPAATPVASAPLLSFPASAAPAAHHLAMLPLLLGGIIAGFLASGGHGGGVAVGTHPPTPPVVVTPTPTPAPVGCPTAVRRHGP